MEKRKGIAFKADKSLIDYLTIKGFKRVQINSDKEYYVNEKGFQIKIDNDTKIIYLLDEKGHTVAYATVFFSDRLNKFMEKGDLD